MPHQRYGSVRDCADDLGITRQRVHQLIKQGKLGKCKKVELTPRHSVWMIPYPFERGRYEHTGNHTWKPV